MSNIPSICLIPSGYKATKVYSVLPTNGDADLTFSRTGDATRINQSGVIETMSTNVPRLDYSNGGCPSLLLEPQSTNLYLNSETLVTQNVTTLASTYTVSFYGTGTITFTGSYSGSLVGTGANDRATLTFTATAGTLTSTITGGVTKGQLENLGYATSYIPTLSTPVQRNSETVSKTGLGSYINSQNGSFYAKLKVNSSSSFPQEIQLRNNISTGQYITLKFTNSTNLEAQYRSAPFVIDAIESGTVIADQYNKVLCTWGAQGFRLTVNGVSEPLQPLANFAPTGSFNEFYFGDFQSGLFEGEIQEVEFYNNQLSQAEAETKTTL